MMCFQRRPPLNLGFRRALTRDKWDAWSHLCHRLMNVHLGDTPVMFVWRLTSSGVFTVKSMYEDLMNEHARFLRTYLWKLKIPLKIKIFMWFLNRKVLLTKDNLARRNWQGCSKCPLCGLEEIVKNLFISCHLSTYNIPPPTIYF